MDQAAIKNATFKTITISELETNLPKVCNVFLLLILIDFIGEFLF
jgi:hypothetical protein